MKTYRNITVAIVTILIFSCSGSESYRGNWNAVDSKGHHFEILFSEKSFSISDSLGGTKDYDYTQNSVQIENSISTYGIKLNDGREYQIQFPNPKDSTSAIMMDRNGYLLYTINRDAFKSFDETYKLN